MTTTPKPKRHYIPKLDPDRDLAGAKPETLALALLGRKPQLRPGSGGETIVGNELPVGELMPGQPDDNRPHLVNGVRPYVAVPALPAAVLVVAQTQ